MIKARGNDAGRRDRAGGTTRRSRKSGRRASGHDKRQHTPVSAAPIEPAAEAPVAAVRRSKKSTVIALLQRPGGAAIAELTAATGWQPHSVRAALTGLRKAGNELVRAKDAAGVTYYRLAATV